MKKIILFLVLLLNVTAMFAQKKEADENVRLLDYNKAIPLYVKYLNTNSTDDDALHQLARCYKITNRITEGIATYKQLVALNKANAADYFELVKLLQIAQNIDEAKTFAKTYQELEPGNKANVMKESLDNYDKYLATADKYKMTNKTLAYDYSVRSALPYKGQILVTAENKKNNTDKSTGGNYTDVFTTDKSFTKLEKFASNLWDDDDDCVPSFSPDGNTMYFTCVNPNSEKSGNLKTYNMHIMSSTLDGSKWTKAVELPFNSNTIQSAHAAVSKSGNLMVFSSNRSGGKGGMDLYYSTLSGTSWSSPVNITNLNTFGNELFPVFNGEDLVFSSNGLPGLGGLDLYKSKFNGNTGFGAPENLKAPFNSSYDDMSLSTADDFNTGYITSNRNGNPQQDDVYYFEKNGVTPIPEAPKAKVGSKGLKIVVKDKYTSTPLPYVSVIVKDEKGNEIQKGLTDENGLVIIDEIECGTYKIQGELNGVTTSIAKVSADDCNTSGPYIEKELLHNDPRFTLRGIVRDATANRPLEGVKVTLKNETNGIEKTITTKADGKFFFQLEQKSNFSVKGEKPKWLSSERAEVTTMGLDRSAELYVDLSLKMYEPTANAVIQLKNIFYDLNKSDIKPKSETELNNLVKLMNDYPDMKIELASHTDCRNTDDYNRALSQRRSESATAYLITKGISKDRIVAKGYGESKLINRCADGVQCSEDEHQINRRTEFTILSCTTCPALKK
jgi:outer membrane protein OmpA-like peptidoglycan-associated protein/tetratricopeptide (TPR) repeat protein